MNYIESLSIAWRALSINKLRSGLTVLGIIVGVAAVVCMVSVGAGAQAEVSERIRTLGANLLLVFPGPQNSGAAKLESGTRPTLTEEDASAIHRELPDVVQVVAPLLSRSMGLVEGNRNWMTLVAGINPDYLIGREWQIASGRAFTSGELANGAKVAIVGSVIENELFERRSANHFGSGRFPSRSLACLARKALVPPAAAKTTSYSFLSRPRKAGSSGPCTAPVGKQWISFQSKSRMQPRFRLPEARSRVCSGSGTAFARMRRAISGSRIRPMF
jgi:putative ABC transport system permease protein